MRATPANSKVFRIATYTGAWSIGETKTVAFKNQTNTPNTANALNLFFPIDTAAIDATDCAIAKDGTGWYLIDVPMKTATAVFIGATQTMVAVTATARLSVLSNTATCIVVTQTAQKTIQDVGGDVSTITYVDGIDLSATLNTANCTITIAKTISTSSISVQIGGSTATAIMVAAFTTGLFASTSSTAAFVTQTATAVVARQTFTAQFLTFRF